MYGIEVNMRMLLMNWFRGRRKLASCVTILPSNGKVYDGQNAFTIYHARGATLFTFGNCIPYYNFDTVSKLALFTASGNWKTSRSCRRCSLDFRQ